jgi:membrane protein DedA with SNARE-associated domain/membrane-associated phospholipid phosphatase
MEHGVGIEDGRLSGITQAVVGFIGEYPHWAGFAIFLIALVESVAVVGLFIPGSPILIAVGAVVGLGHLPLWPMLVWATAGAIIGDGVSFELGRRYRATILGVWPVSRYPAVVARGETFFRRHGGKSIALGRFLPMLRPMIPMVAGALGLRPGLFYAVNIASAIVWAPAHILGGALLGASLGALGAVSGRLVAMLAVLAVALLVLILSTRWLWRRLMPLLGWAQQGLHRWAMARGSRAARLLARLADPEEPDLRIMALLGAVVLILVAGFVNLLSLVAAHGELARADGAISAFVQGLRTPWSDAVLTSVTMLGDGTTIGVMAVVAIAWLLLRRAWHRAGGVAIAMAVTAGFVPLVKSRLQIVRPTDLYSGADAFSFPSGHAAFSAVLYGILGWLVARGLTGRWQALPLTLAAALIGLICASRIYLAAHWPSDVAAGLLFGTGMTIAFAMVFRGAAPGRIRPRAFAAVLLLALAVAGGGHVAANYQAAAAMYARRDATVASDRSQPRHRPCHRDPLFQRRLARHHLFAASVSGRMPVGRRARGSHPGRPRRPCRHRARDLGNPRAAGRRRAARAGQQRRDLAEGRRWRRPARLDRYRHRDLEPCVPGQFLRADHDGARADRGIEGRQGLGRQRHLDRGLARASVRGRGLRDLEGGAGLIDPRDGVGFRPHRRPRQFDRAGRDRHLDPVAGHREDRRSADPAAPARHAGRSGQDHLCAVHGDEFLRQRRRDPHQRRPARQAKLPTKITYGVTNKAATPLIPAQYMPGLPTNPANLSQAIPINDSFWIDNIDSLTERFNTWAAK